MEACAPPSVLSRCEKKLEKLKAFITQNHCYLLYRPYKPYSAYTSGFRLVDLYGLTIDSKSSGTQKESFQNIYKLYLEISNYQVLHYSIKLPCENQCITIITNDITTGIIPLGKGK